MENKQARDDRTQGRGVEMTMNIQVTVLTPAWTGEEWAPDSPHAL